MENPLCALPAQNLHPSRPCVECRRRRVRCGREHPIYTICQRLGLGGVCKYPERQSSTAMKKGGKQKRPSAQYGTTSPAILSDPTGSPPQSRTLIVKLPIKMKTPDSKSRQKMASYQAMNGQSAGRNRYVEPTFWALIEGHVCHGRSISRIYFLILYASRSESAMFFSRRITMIL